MDRSAILRWLFIALAVGGIVLYGPSACKDGKVQQLPAETYINSPAFMPDNIPGEGTERPPEGELCSIKGVRFTAELSSRGAGLRHFLLDDAKYSVPGDMSTTPDHERWRSLRTLFRGGDANTQVAYDRFLWKLEKSDGVSCVFSYTDEGVRIEKTIAATDRPFEVTVDTTVTNTSDAAKRHQFQIESHAYRLYKDVKGSWGRISPFVTELSCAKTGDVVRKMRDEFKEGGWLEVPNTDRYAAVNNGYFTQAMVLDGDTATCSIVAEDWLSPGQARDDENAITIYHARLTYPARELAPQATAKYKQFVFFGPKERAVLAKAAGGKGHLLDTIPLGFFAPVARVLVTVLNFFHDHVAFGSWGVSIILMTVAIRMLLFPLQLKAIKSSLDMRKLRPELDEITKKFEGDMQAKNLATMELYKKRGINPLGGCLPSLVQMPVWFAMFTTLQTAVEMYQTKFLWFSDLSSPDRFFILPAVLGASILLQQKIMPVQPGMDPVQQKMMTWLMPVVFIVMQLLVPAALGIYSLTNSVIFILQQVVVEKIAERKGISVKPIDKKA